MMRTFFSEWRFPTVAVALMTAAVALMGAMLLVPPSAGSAYAFAEEFKRLCFGYDAVSGGIEWAYLWMFLVQPLLMCGLIVLLWRSPLSAAWKRHRGQLLRWAGVTVILTVTMGLSLPAIYPVEVPDDPTKFPGNAIRTALPAAPFDLENQEETPISLDSLDRVIVVTAVYASCVDTCPLILQQIKEAVAGLSPEEIEQVTVLAISMDPAKDTPAMLSMTADHYKVSAPRFNLLTGDPEYVATVLDRYGFVRKRLPNGEIQHANLVHVIDREGLIAFRFSLGPIQKAWLTEALRLTIGEGAA